MKNKNNYKNNRSAQQARQIRRNREKNCIRLAALKRAMGCYACGRCDIDPSALEGHHWDGISFKYRPLAHLLGRSWKRVMQEILGLFRDRPGGGGPVVFVCRRFHRHHHKSGLACPCTEEQADQLKKGGIEKP